MSVLGKTWIGVRKRLAKKPAAVLIYRHVYRLCASLYSLGKPEPWGNLKYLCIFVGHPRSGHTLVAAILDAHPSIVISNELNAVKLFHWGFNRRAVFHQILLNSAQFTRLGTTWAGYRYRVPGQWNGCFDVLRVLGDKKGGLSVLRLAENPGLLGHMAEVAGAPVKLVHVVRNPFDNISTIARKHGVSLEESVRFYFNICRALETVKGIAKPDDWFELRHEELIGSPRGQIEALCRFLGQETSEEYLSACASIVKGAPSRTRFEVGWSESLVRSVQDGIEGTPWLHGYGWSEGGVGKEIARGAGI